MSNDQIISQLNTEEKLAFLQHQLDQLLNAKKEISEKLAKKNLIIEMCAESLGLDTQCHYNDAFIISKMKSLLYDIMKEQKDAKQNKNAIA